LFFGYWRASLVLLSDQLSIKTTEGTVAVSEGGWERGKRSKAETSSPHPRSHPNVKATSSKLLSRAVCAVDISTTVADTGEDEPAPDFLPSPLPHYVEQLRARAWMVLLTLFDSTLPIARLQTPRESRESKEGSRIERVE
jgi:hypothetical protein